MQKFWKMPKTTTHFAPHSLKLSHHSFIYIYFGVGFSTLRLKLWFSVLYVQKIFANCGHELTIINHQHSIFNNLGCQYPARPVSSWSPWASWWLTSTWPRPAVLRLPRLQHQAGAGVQGVRVPLSVFAPYSYQSNTKVRPLESILTSNMWSFQIYSVMVRTNFGDFDPDFVGR